MRRPGSRRGAVTGAAALVLALAGGVVATPGTASALPGGADAKPESAGQESQPETGPETVRVEIPGLRMEDGHRMAGSGHTRVSVHGRKAEGAEARGPLSAAEAQEDGRVTKVVDNGPSSDRLDIVFVGDGYTAAETEQFHTDLKAKWAEVTSVEPYTTYQNLFNVWAVDAVSQESGVSGDPGPEVVRDTALGSYFWCGDIERLLCVDEAKVDSYVAKAPEVELVMVLANSTKYGGAGYNTPNPQLGYEGISTASAGNAQSGQVAIHETGHSLGKLADEYFYPDTPGYELYEGPEPADSNISTLSADEMASGRTKWYRWLGETSPDGGTVGAYEGGGYYVRGLNRPTDASMMRVLDKPFNLPGTEAMIAGFYRHASAATAVTPTDRTLRPGSTVRAEVPKLAGGARLDVQWYLDGRRMAKLAGRTSVRVTDLDRDVLRDRRPHELTLRVTDRTESVRDPQIAESLTDTLTWRVRR